MKLEDTRLGPILEAVRQASARRRAVSGLDSLRERATSTGDGEAFVTALKQSPLSILAEHKRYSPSVGNLEDGTSVEQRCSSYAQQGARALSILTEEQHFHGSLTHLQQAAVAGLPRLRKDFVLDPWMVEESAAAGADAILLMVICLPGSLLQELTSQAQELGLAVLCEVHDASELERALAVQPDCIGVNARDLRSFEIDPRTTLNLLPQVPSSFVRVAESGLATYEDILAVRAAGADAALIGSALMRSPDCLQSWTSRLAAEVTQ